MSPDIYDPDKYYNVDEVKEIDHQIWFLMRTSGMEIITKSLIDREMEIRKQETSKHKRYETKGNNKQEEKTLRRIRIKGD